MSKIMKMRDSRDKIIDQLIDDKNRIYTRLKREERENQVLRSQVKYLKQRLAYAEKKMKELSNEIVDSRAKEKGSGDSEAVRQ
jgi:cell division septum initiation protein DivIVA